MQTIFADIYKKFSKTMLLFPLMLLVVVADETPQSTKKTTPIYVEKGLAIGGYDPVAYFKQNKPVKGNKQHTYIWQGEKWYFSSSANLAQFKKNPLAYYPQYGGHCAYGVAEDYLVRGDGRAWTILDGKLYLNYNLAIRKRWLRDTAGYLKKSEKNWPDLN